MYSSEGQTLERPQSTNLWCCSIAKPQQKQFDPNYTYRIDRLISKDAPLPLNTIKTLDHEINFQLNSENLIKYKKKKIKKIKKKENVGPFQSSKSTLDGSKDFESCSETIQKQTPLMHLHTQKSCTDEGIDEVKIKALRKKKQKETNKKVSSKNYEQFNKEQAQKLKEEMKKELKKELRERLKEEIKKELKEKLKTELKQELKDELKEELKEGLKEELKDGLEEELKKELKKDLRKVLKEELKEGMKKQFPEKLVKVFVDNPHKKGQNSRNKLSISLAGINKNERNYLKRTIRQTLERIRAISNPSILQKENFKTKPTSTIKSIDQISCNFGNTSETYHQEVLGPQKKQQPKPSTSQSNLLDGPIAFENKRRKQSLKLMKMRKRKFPLNSSFNNRASKSTNKINENKNFLQMLLKSFQEKILLAQQDVQFNENEVTKYLLKLFQDDSSDAIDVQRHEKPQKSISPKKFKRNMKLCKKKRKILYEQLVSWNMRNKYLAEALKCSFEKYENFVIKNFHVLFSKSLLELSQKEVLRSEMTDDHSDHRKLIASPKISNKKDPRNDINKVYSNLLQSLDEQKSPLFSCTNNSDVVFKLSTSSQTSPNDTFQGSMLKFSNKKESIPKVPLPRKNHLKRSSKNKSASKRKSLCALKNVKNSSCCGQKQNNKTRRRSEG